MHRDETGPAVVDESGEIEAVVPVGGEVVDGGVREDGAEPGEEEAAWALLARGGLELATGDDGNLVVEDQAPEEAQDDLEVAVDNIRCTWGWGEGRGRGCVSDYNGQCRVLCTMAVCMTVASHWHNYYNTKCFSVL